MSKDDVVELETLLDRYSLVMRDRLELRSRVEEFLNPGMKLCLALIYAPLIGQQNDEELQKCVAPVMEEVVDATIALRRTLEESGIKLKRLMDERSGKEETD